MKTEKLKEYDVVALLKEMPDRKLLRGQVGTIVHQYTETDFEVEFADTKGVEIAIVTLKSEDLILLHHEMEYVGK
jgi:uncharacterized protein YceH (UPF0502 family)